VITIPLRYGMKFTEKVENFDPIKGSIIGVSGGNKIWFASDSKTKDTVGAWFWHADDLASMILADVIQFDCGDNTGDLLHLDETSTLDELKVSFDSFIEIFYRNISTKDRDAEICRLATNAGNSFSIDPTSLPAQYLFNEFQSKEFDAIASCIRYIFLVCMNSIAGTVLPYTDFGVTDERHLHISTEFSKPNCHFEPFLVSAQHFHSLKPAILLKTKTSYWNAVIRETVTPTEPVREILDIPNDIDRDEIRGNLLEHLLTSFVRVLLYLLSRTIFPVNRIEAKTVDRNKELRNRQGLTKEEILRKSVFGQLLSAVSQYDDRKLRRQYTHLLDGGQSRVFYVKLIGEAAEDNGGPYRTVFLDAIGDEAINTLELLKCVPDRVDKTIFNSHLLASSSHTFYRDLFTHLGRLFLYYLLTYLLTYP